MLTTHSLIREVQICQQRSSDRVRDFNTRILLYSTFLYNLTFLQAQGPLLDLYDVQYTNIPLYYYNIYTCDNCTHR